MTTNLKSAGYIKKVFRKHGWVFVVVPSGKFMDTFPERKSAKADTKEEAEEIIRQWHREWETHTKVGTNTSIYAPEGSVHTLISAWMRSIDYLDNTESTRRNYRSLINRLMKWELWNPTLPERLRGVPFSDMAIADVDYPLASAIFQLVSDEITPNNGAVTIIRLRAAWNEGMRVGLAAVNPFVLVKIPKGHVRRVMWTSEQINNMVAFCDANGKTSMGTVITMCYEWMQRPVDIRLLKWSDLKVNDGVAEFAQRKTGAEMRIPITKGIEERLKLHEKHNSDDFIIREENSLKPYTSDRLTWVFAGMRSASGLLAPVRDKGKLTKQGKYVYTDIRLSDLRRTGVTHASEFGCTHDELMSISGHKNIASLLVYSVITETNARNAMNKRGLDVVGFKKLGKEAKRYRNWVKGHSLPGGWDLGDLRQRTSELNKIIQEQQSLIKELQAERANHG